MLPRLARFSHTLRFPTFLERSVSTLPHWIGFEAVNSTETIPNVNPATGSLNSLISRGGAEEVDMAVHKALGAVEAFGSFSIQDRSDLLMAVASRIEERVDEFAVAEMNDTGKPFSLAKGLDIRRSIDNFKFFAKELQSFHGDMYYNDTPSPGYHFTSHSPVGVCGLISPWNLPLYLLSWKVAPAIAMGNAIVCKPSELTPTTAYLMGDVFREVCDVDGLVSVIQGYGHEVGEAIVSHPDVSAISFTGGTLTGRRVGEHCGRNLKKVSLELGGKNPCVVFKDCDVDRVVDHVVRSSFLNSGQICLCSSRLIVQEDFVDAFTERLLSRVNQLTIGAPTFLTGSELEEGGLSTADVLKQVDGEVNVGPVISTDHRNKIEEKVAHALTSRQVELIWQHPSSNLFEDRQKAFMPPTILRIHRSQGGGEEGEEDGDTNRLPILQEETFGPVITIQTFSSMEEALDLANSTSYGLAATVYSNDINKITYVASKLETGLVWANTWLLRDLRTPFGGMKESGIGREGGKYSFNFFSNLKTTSIGLNHEQIAHWRVEEGGGEDGAQTTNRNTTTPIRPAPPLPGKRLSDQPVRCFSTQPPVTAGGAGAREGSGGEKIIHTKTAPKPVGAYPHARIVKTDAPLLYISGIGARNPVDNSIPGGPVRDENKNPSTTYDIRLQTHQCIQNIETILADAGLTLNDVVDCTCFLINMDRDFQGFNEVYRTYFQNIQATRTTVAITALPTEIAVEMKVIAQFPADHPSLQK